VTQFELIFKGELVKGFSLEQVQQNVGKLFKASPAQVEQMFSGRAIVLRNKLDQATGQKYRSILQKSGAVCELREMKTATATESAKSSPTPQQVAVAAAASSPSGSASVSPSSQSGSAPSVSKSAPVETATGLPVAGDKVDEILADISWDIAPAGARLAEQADHIPLPEHDLSHLSVAPAGTDMGEKKKPAAPPPPDTSHIKIDN